MISLFYKKCEVSKVLTQSKKKQVLYSYYYELHSPLLYLIKYYIKKHREGRLFILHFFFTKCRMNNDFIKNNNKIMLLSDDFKNKMKTYYINTILL